MNEQTPRDPQQPDHAAGANDQAPNDPTPREPIRPADAPDDTATRVDHEAVADGPRKRGRGILKPVLIGSAAALTVLAVAGVGMTIVDAVDDDDEPSSSPSASSAPLASGAPTPTDAPSASEPGDDRGGDRGEDGSDVAGSDDASVAGAASSTPSDLVAAIETAITAAGGGAATSIEVELGAWKVDVRLDDGSELDVLVPVSGDAVVREDDDDDRSSDLPLEPARIADIVDAAVAAAGGGSVVSIETDDDQPRFEVEVALNGDDVDVELADDLEVLSVER